MRMLIVGVEQVKADERYLDDKGWSFKKAFDKLDIQSETFFYKKKGKMAFIEKNKYIKILWQAYMNKLLLKHVLKTKPDILFIAKGETISPETLWIIRKKTDTILINVFPDNPLYMGKFEAIEPYHYFFVKDSYVHDILRRAGLKNVFYLPQCTDPDVHRPIELNDADKIMFSNKLSLIGSMYPYREKFIEQLIDFKPAIWGRGWSNSKNQEIVKLYKGKDIRGTQKVKAICGSLISLNPHHPINDINGVNRRTYDIAACKGFQLADVKQDMNNILKINDEIVCYKTIEQLRKLIKYYIDHPDERKQIAESAFNRVTKEHTYFNRAQEILALLKSGL